jgi:predicted secreted protein
MSNQRLKGREVMIFTGDSHATTQAVGCSTACELEISCDAIEISSPSSGQARDYLAGRTGWRMSLDKLLLLPDFYDGIKVGTKIVVWFAYSINSKEGISPEDRFAAHYYEGAALVTRWVCSAKNGDFASGTFEFLGCGPLSDIDLPNFILDENQLDDRDVELE